MFIISNKILSIYQNIARKNTFYLVGKKACEKVRDEVVKVMESSGKHTSREVEIDRLEYPKSKTSRRYKRCPKRTKQQFSTTTFIPKECCGRKAAFGALYVEGEGQG